MLLRCGLFSVVVLSARADEMITAANDLVNIDSAVDVYSDMDTNSSVIVSYVAGDVVYMTGESENWIQVFYRGQNGYIPKSAITSAESAIGNGSGVENSTTKDSEAQDDDLLENISGEAGHIDDELTGEGDIAINKVDIDADAIDKEFEATDELMEELLLGDGQIDENQNAVHEGVDSSNADSNVESMTDYSSYIWIAIMAMAVILFIVITIFENKKSHEIKIEELDVEDAIESDNTGFDVAVEDDEFDVELDSDDGMEFIDFH